MHLGFFVGGSCGFFVSRLNGVQGGVEWMIISFSHNHGSGQFLYMKGTVAMFHGTMITGGRVGYKLQLTY